VCRGDVGQPWRAGAVRRPRGYTISTRYVYDRGMTRVRTNIELESTYVEAIMDRFGVHTKTAAVDLALRHLAGQPMSQQEALAMRGAHAIGDVPADTAAANTT